MKKIITISLTLFGIVFLAGCSLQPASQTPSTTSTAVTQQSEQSTTTTPPTDETAGWKTYTNPTFGYSIKYPPTWTEKQSEQSNRPEDIKNSAIEFNNDNSLMLIIRAYKISDRQAFVGALTNGQYKGDSNLLSIISNGTDKNNTDPNIIAYKIGNLDGYRKLATSSVGDINNGFKISSMFTYMAQDSKNIYEYKTIFTNKNVESPEIVKMLKTFTTKKTDETANWKTYTNDKYGFEIKYPKDLQIFASGSKGANGGIVAVGDITFNVLSSANNTSAENWYAQYYQDVKKESKKLDYPFFLSTGGESVQLNGYTAYKVGHTEPQISVFDFYLLHNGSIYDLSYQSPDMGVKEDALQWPEQEKIILQMLATLKFTK